MLVPAKQITKSLHEKEAGFSVFKQYRLGLVVFTLMTKVIGKQLVVKISCAASPLELNGILLIFNGDMRTWVREQHIVGLLKWDISVMMTCLLS